MTDPTPTEEVFKHIDSYIDRLAEAGNSLTAQYGKDALDVAIEVTRMHGIVNELTGFSLLALTAFFAQITRKLGKWASNNDYDGAEYFPIIGVCVATLLVFVGSLCDLLDFWNLIAIFNPKIALVHQIIEAATSHK